MKKILIISGFLFSTAFLLTACDKEIKLTAPVEMLDGNSPFLKVNYVSGYASNPQVQILINGQRVSNVITGRTPFPGGGYNTGGGSSNDYIPMKEGSSSLWVTIPKKGTNSDSIILVRDMINLAPNTYYTAHITDTGSNSKVLLLIDDLTKPDTSLAKHRFVNLMPNVPAVDLYYGTTLVASNIAYLTSSDYFTVSTYAPALAWTVREAGADPSTTALATYTSANTILNQRVYTAFALGYKGRTDAPRKPYISFLLNK